jgi:hypothetical protein
MAVGLTATAGSILIREAIRPMLREVLKPFRGFIWFFQFMMFMLVVNVFAMLVLIGVLVSK